MLKTIENFDVVIVGAGASGLMCGISAGKRGRKVLILDHNNKVGKKILIAGGGKCNFTNYDIIPENYISQNPHFVKSALSRFNQWHFLEMINDYKIPFEERNFGQLFCKQSSKDIVNMLIGELNKFDVNIYLNTAIEDISKIDKFQISTPTTDFTCESLVIATGGLSYPSVGATNFGYKIARQFGLNVINTSPGLAPLLYGNNMTWSALSGISVTAKISYREHTFTDELLFTHKGISGPAALQISNYWKKGERIFIDFLPNKDLHNELQAIKTKVTLKNYVKQYLPERLIKLIIKDNIDDKPLNQYTIPEIEKIHKFFHQFPLLPKGKDSYKKAEVTLGGVNTNDLSSKTFESNKVKNLYFTGEILDVTGWLGGYNLQWAWSSGWCAGLYV